MFAGIAGYLTGERLGAINLVGAAVILVGIAVSELGSASRDSRPAEEVA